MNMAIILVTYDLRKPGRNYEPVYEYLKRFTYCHHLESVWLLDTNKSTEAIRDELKPKVDANDAFFVVRIQRDWGALNFGCGTWLNANDRNW